MTWTEKWKPYGLSETWKSFFISNNHDTHPGINYPRIKTHEPGNPARVITSGCGSPNENLSLFVEQYCKVIVDTIPCRIRDIAYMLDIIDKLNIEGIRDDDLLVSFDIINMFPAIDNEIGVQRVKCKLNEYVNIDLMCQLNASLRLWKFA